MFCCVLFDHNWHEVFEREFLRVSPSSKYTSRISQGFVDRIKRIHRFLNAEIGNCVSESFACLLQGKICLNELFGRWTICVGQVPDIRTVPQYLLYRMPCGFTGYK